MSVVLRDVDSVAREAEGAANLKLLLVALTTTEHAAASEGHVAALTALAPRLLALAERTEDPLIRVQALGGAALALLLCGAGEKADEWTDAAIAIADAAGYPEAVFSSYASRGSI